MHNTGFPQQLTAALSSQAWNPETRLFKASGVQGSCQEDKDPRPEPEVPIAPPTNPEMQKIMLYYRGLNNWNRVLEPIIL